MPLTDRCRQREKLNETKTKRTRLVLKPRWQPCVIPMIPRPGTQALVVSRADKIVIPALFASSLARNNLMCVNLTRNIASYRRSGLLVRVWYAYGKRRYVAQAYLCGARSILCCVAHVAPMFHIQPLYYHVPVYTRMLLSPSLMLLVSYSYVLVCIDMLLVLHSCDVFLTIILNRFSKQTAIML